MIEMLYKLNDIIGVNPFMYNAIVVAVVLLLYFFGRNKYYYFCGRIIKFVLKVTGLSLIIIGIMDILSITTGLNYLIIFLVFIVLMFSATNIYLLYTGASTRSYEYQKNKLKIQHKKNTENIMNLLRNQCFNRNDVDLKNSLIQFTYELLKDAAIEDEEILTSGTLYEICKLINETYGKDTPVNVFIDTPNLSYKSFKLVSKMDKGVLLLTNQSDVKDKNLESEVTEDGN